MDNTDLGSEIGIVVGIIVVVGIICLPIVFGAYWVDKHSCYDRARNYSTEVSSYSFVKNYCFVQMNGRAVNLENYRDTNEIK